MKKKCSVEGCEKSSRTRGVCIGHYAQFKKHGKIVRPILGVFEKRICTVDGCTRERSTKLYCNAHYLQMKTYGRITSVETLHRNKWKVCVVDGCADSSYCKGYCCRHYSQIIKYGEIKYQDRVMPPRIGEMRNQGYIYIYKKDHPMADQRGYVKRANIIWEENTGHMVVPPEIIHHKNEIRNDDSFENLQLLANPSEHMKLHGRRGVSDDEIKAEVLRVYKQIGQPFTSMRFKEASRISITTVVERFGWNNIKEELCIP